MFRVCVCILLNYYNNSSLQFRFTRATGTLRNQLLFKDTTVLQMCEEGGILNKVLSEQNSF